MDDTNEWRQTEIERDSATMILCEYETKLDPSFMYMEEISRNLVGGSEYDNKQRLMVRLDFWRSGGVGNTPSLPLLQGPLWLRVEVPVRVPSLGESVSIFFCIQ